MTRDVNTSTDFGQGRFTRIVVGHGEGRVTNGMNSKTKIIVKGGTKISLIPSDVFISFHILFGCLV